MNSGQWISINRKMMKKGYYKDSHYLHLWVHLLFRANFKDEEFLWNGKLEKIKRGQFITGRNVLVEETGINRSKIERILKVFESEHQIKQQKTNKHRIITILNYNKYQDSNSKVSNKRATSEQQVSTSNKDNKNNNIYSVHFEEFWTLYPKKISKIVCGKIWNKNNLDSSLQEILEALKKQRGCAQWTKDNGQFIPNPSTWLGQRRWEDEIEIIKPKEILL